MSWCGNSGDTAPSGMSAPSPGPGGTLNPETPVSSSSTGPQGGGFGSFMEQALMAKNPLLGMALGSVGVGNLPSFGTGMQYLGNMGGNKPTTVMPSQPLTINDPAAKGGGKSNMSSAGASMASGGKF